MKTIEFDKIKKNIIKQIENIDYKGGDLSDIGNEIGIVIGEYTMMKTFGFNLQDFISGLEHGVSLVDGTHVSWQYKEYDGMYLDDISKIIKRNDSLEPDQLYGYKLLNHRYEFLKYKIMLIQEVLDKRNK